MQDVDILTVVKEGGALIAFLAVVVRVGQNMITSLVTNITAEIREGMKSICDRFDAQTGARSIDQQAILKTIQDGNNMLVGLIANRPICPLGQQEVGK